MKWSKSDEVVKSDRVVTGHGWVKVESKNNKGTRAESGKRVVKRVVKPGRTRSTPLVCVIVDPVACACVCVCE